MYPLAGEAIAAAGLGLGLTVPKVLFALSLGAFFYFLGNVAAGKKLCFRAQATACGIASGLLVSQFIYWKIFNTPYFLKSAAGLAAAMEFWRVVLLTAAHNWLCTALLLAQPLLLATVYRRWFYAAHERGTRRAAALACALLAAFGLAVGLSERGGAGSPRSLLLGSYVPVSSARTFGILPTMALDLKCIILGVRIPDPLPQTVPLSALKTGTAPSAPAADGPDTSRAENRLDLRFDLDEQDPVLRDMNRYFSSRTPTRQNAYTGMFKGKNLILITAESFSKFVIDPVRTPTLYKLYSEGFRFNHFYTALWGVSTTDGEFAATTSLVPENGVWSYTKLIGHSMPLALGNQFAAQGMDTFAFHDHSYTYYNRDRTYPTMGYTYYGIGHGLDITPQWPESDVELMEQSVPYYAGSKGFHAYYMTVSGHLPYTFGGDSMAQKHRAQVENLPCSETVKAYIGGELELEEALTTLLQQLSAAGQLDNTVIALSGDHYPYGLSHAQYRELRGGQDFDSAFGLYENGFLLWTPGLGGPIDVDTCCSSLDILPTLSNLFGLPYDSRLMMGTDIFSGTAPMVLFYDHSFISDRLMYDATGRRLLTRTDAPATQQELDSAVAEMENRFTYSAKIIETDYYRYLFG